MCDGKPSEWFFLQKMPHKIALFWNQMAGVEEKINNQKTHNPKVNGRHETSSNNRHKGKRQGA